MSYRGELLAAAAIQLLAGAAYQTIEGATPAPAPTIEVFLPSSAGRAQGFNAHAVASGCAPKSWAWRASPGCAILAGGATDSPLASCSATGNATLQATAMGGGCAAAQGSSSLVIAGADPVSIGGCDGTQPGPVVSIATGWYYRPGLQSTGQLKLAILGPDGKGLATSPTVPAPPLKVRQTITTQECVEVPRP